MELYCVAWKINSEHVTQKLVKCFHLSEFMEIYEFELLKRINKARFIKPYDSENANTLSQETIFMLNERLFARATFPALCSFMIKFFSWFIFKFLVVCWNKREYFHSMPHFYFHIVLLNSKTVQRWNFFSLFFVYISTMLMLFVGFIQILFIGKWDYVSVFDSQQQTEKNIIIFNWKERIKQIIIVYLFCQEIGTVLANFTS